MIPDNINTSKIMEILETLVAGEQGELTLVLQNLLNELALCEREKYLGAKAYERTETRLGYANGFKAKTE